MSARALILVVEDDEILGHSLQQRLRLEGWHVRWANRWARRSTPSHAQTPNRSWCNTDSPTATPEA